MVVGFLWRKEMSNKIIVEFNREKLKNICRTNGLIDKFGTPLCEGCKQRDREILKCNLVFAVDFKIKKEPNNGRKKIHNSTSIR